MTQTYLITRSDIAEYRQISDSVFDNVLNQHILDAQFSDVQTLMGVNFYNDLIRNYTDTNYQTLLNGGVYDYNDITYTNVGLKAVLVHYAYARYILMGSQTDTPFGYVEKINDNSERVSQSNKNVMAKMNQQVAFNYWENVKLFIDRNSDDYPMYDTYCINRNKSFRISKIGGGNKKTYDPYLKRYI